MTPKISKKNQLFHVQYLSNGLTTGNFKKIAKSKKPNKNKTKLNTTLRYLNLCIWMSLENRLSNFSSSS